MLDVETLRSLHPVPRPLSHKLLLRLVHRLDYWSGARTRIVVENLEALPEDPRVFLAMNHTDRYSTAPLLVTLMRRRDRFAATWVKGKYYEDPRMAAFMNASNQIPLPSWGYLLASRFKAVAERKPSDAEFAALQAHSRGEAPATDALAPALLEQLTAAFGAPTLPEGVSQLYAAMMDEVLRINSEALDCGLSILVYPEGTRSLRLTRGRTGLVQVAGRLGVPIVPVGCSGGDVLYPADSPISSGGTVTLRVGAPLRWDDDDTLGPHRVDAPYTPLTREATAAHGAAFRAQTDVVMAAIEALIDPQYGPRPDGASEGVSGVARFL